MQQSQKKIIGGPHGIQEPLQDEVATHILFWENGPRQ